MLIAGLIVFLFILGMFFQALSSPPRAESEWQIDTDEDNPATPVSTPEGESRPMAA